MGLMNSISSFSSTNSIKEKKEIKSSFMPKIERESKNKKFLKLSRNLTKYLFDFFSYNELYEMGKINSFFLNNTIEYINENEPWPEKVRKFKKKYNLTIYQGEVDLTQKEAQINKRKYKFPSENEKEVNYYQFDIDGNRYLSIARTFNWAHKDNPSYWSEEEIGGGYEENKKVPYLKTVCWVDVNFSFLYVRPNNYKLYINENFIKGYNLKERFKLKVIIDENIVLYEKKFPDQKTFDSNQSERQYAKLKEDFICYIKKEDFNCAKKNENNEYKIKVLICHIDHFWKDGWFIDGGSLKEITQKEMDYEIERLKKIEEENERKKFFGKKENDDENCGDSLFFI